MNKNVVIVGGSGHAKVIIDIINSLGKYNISGFTSMDDREKTLVGDVPYLGDDSVLPQIFKNGVSNAVIAIGDCKVRDLVFNKTQKLGFRIIPVISPYTHISPTVKIGDGVVIMPGAIINVDTRIGDNTIINTGATLDHDNYIGKSVHIAPGSNLAGNVTVGDGTFLGIGCRVIPGIKIGEWSTVGAGSVVIKNIPSYTTSVGIPAEVIKVNNKKNDL